jgi:hypothetical protein
MPDASDAVSETSDAALAMSPYLLATRTLSM